MSIVLLDTQIKAIHFHRLSQRKWFQFAHLEFKRKYEYPCAFFGIVMSRNNEIKSQIHQFVTKTVQMNQKAKNYYEM